MDRNSLIGLLIIGVILLGFAWFNSKQADKFAQEKAVADSIARVEGRIVDLPAESRDGEPQESVRESAGAAEGMQESSSQADSIRIARYGTHLLNAEKGEEHRYVVENGVMRITFSNRGGKVTSVELKDYKTFDGKPIEMYADDSAQFDMVFFLRNQYGDTRINSGNYYFECDRSPDEVISVTEGEQTVSMRLYADTASYVEYLYTVKKDDHMLGFEVRFVNMDNMFSNQSVIQFSWGRIGRQNERSFKNENRYSTISYKFPGDNSVNNIGMSEGAKESFVKNSLRWVAFKQQFFSSVFIADNNFMNAQLKFDTFAPESGNLKDFSADFNVSFNRNNPNYNFRFYYGPNRFSLLRQYGEGLEGLVPLGWSIVRWVNKGIVIPVFDFLGKHISSYGLIILLLTILIKILTLPLTYKSYLSMAKMRLLKPEMDNIAAKFPKKEDAMKKQQATMELYKKAGVSPMGGCIPMLIQFPILVALFYFFPSSIELRGESFLWADDLSSYDNILNLPFNIPFYGSHVSLFTLLMAVSTFLSTKFNPQTAPSNQIGSMKLMTYMMPVMLLFLFNNFASGLSYYYLLSNLLTMGQTWGFRYIVNDEKLHAKMKANAGKPKKKSRFQARYENMMKAQQQQQKQQKQIKKGK